MVMLSAGPAANHLEALSVVLQLLRAEQTHHNDVF